MKHTFSIDTSLAQPAKSKFERDLEQLDSRLEEIYRKATVKDVPVVQSIVQHLDPSQTECKTLAKVFARIADLLEERRELVKKISILESVSSDPDWLYGQIGNMERDADVFIRSLYETPEEELK